MSCPMIKPGLCSFVAVWLTCVGLTPLTSYAVAEAPDAQDAAQPNALTPEEAGSGWILLFDGKTSDGWRNYGRQSTNPGWKVIDGTLVRVDNGAGDLVTVGQYESFELSLEYKISRGGNSGVMFQVVEQGDYPWMTGPEAQIVDNQEGHDPQLSGWIYALYPSDVDATKPAGQWNQLRIVATRKKCQTYINGIKYLEYVPGSDDWDSRVAKSKFAAYPVFGKATTGHIALQDHQAWVAFRNIKLRPIQDDGD